MSETTPETMAETTESALDPDALRLVEALLFASSDPLDAASLRERLPDGADIPALMAALAAHYEARGVNVVRIANGWTLRTAPDLAPRLKLERTVTRKLSRAATETLAIIAYHQPVTRAEIEDIRGVAISKGTLDTLMEAGWITPRGHKQTVGRPATWVTTDEFLLHFGLADLGDLPGIDELRASGLIGPRSATTLHETVTEAPPDEEAQEDDRDRPPAMEPEREPVAEPEPESDAEEAAAVEREPAT